MLDMSRLAYEVATGINRINSLALTGGDRCPVDFRNPSEDEIRQYESSERIPLDPEETFYRVTDPAILPDGPQILSCLEIMEVLSEIKREEGVAYSMQEVLDKAVECDPTDDCFCRDCGQPNPQIYGDECGGGDWDEPIYRFYRTSCCDDLCEDESGKEISYREMCDRRV